MRHMFSIHALAAFLTLAAVLSARGLLGAEKAPNPSQRKPAATIDKLKELGNEVGRILALTADLFSGNEADLLSKNKTALLSGNCPALLSGNNPKVLSENQTPIFSGNSFSVLSNIKVEIHIDNRGNSVSAGTPPQPSKK